MMKRIATLLMFLWLSAAGAARIELFATADLHGRIEPFLVLAPLLRTDRPAVRIDCGDTVQGTALSSFTSGVTMIDALNALGFDFWIPGNHDFEYGFARMSALGARFRGTTLGADWQWFAWRPARWAVAECGGFRVAVIGLTDPKMPRRAAPGGGLEFLPPDEAIRRILPEILKAKPDLVVLAWHAGIYSAPGSLHRFLCRFPEIDLVIGAHSHEEHPGERIAGAWYVQPGCHAQAAAHIVAEFDDTTRRLIRIESELLRPDPEHPAKDEALESLLTPALTEARRIAVRVLCTTGTALRMPGRGEYNAPLGRLGVLALRAAAPEADGALFTCGAPAFGLPRELTEETIYRMFPFENRVATIRLNRNELERLVEEQLRQSKKLAVVPYFDGLSATVTRTGRLIRLDAPPTIRLALSDYTLLSSAVLRPLLDEPRREWRISEELEREAIRRYLFQHPGWTPPRGRWLTVVPPQ